MRREVTIPVPEHKLPTPDVLATMAEEIAQLKQLQVEMNSAFDNLFKSVQDSPDKVGVIASAKERIGTMAQITLGTVLGPAFSILGFTSSGRFAS